MKQRGGFFGLREVMDLAGGKKMRTYNQFGLGKKRGIKKRGKKTQRGGGDAMMAMMAAPLLMPLLGKMMGQ